jgi:hypothetical protein
MSKVQTHKHTRPRKRSHVRRHARLRDHGRAKARREERIGASVKSEALGLT